MNTFFNKYVRPFAKAHFGGFGSALGLILIDTQGNFGAIGNLTGTQWTDVVILALGIGGLIGLAPSNKPYVAPVAPAFPSQDVTPDASV